MFSDDEVTRCTALLTQPVQPVGTDDIRSATVRRIMEDTAAMLAARGGTMTSNLLSHVMGHIAAGASDHKTAAQIGQHLVAQGARIVALEATVGTAQHEVAEMDAALRVVVPDIEARLSSTCVWCGAPAPQPTTTETLRAHVTAHVRICQEHPMRALEQRIAALEQSNERATTLIVSIGALVGQREGEPTADAVRRALAGLQAFKAYVHQRLDEAAVPTHPNGPHSAAGCRIGDRLDIALARLKPSGQVADDVRTVLAAIASLPITTSETAIAAEVARTALNHLATTAQGYEALRAVCAAVSKSVGFTGPSERLAEAVESAMELSRKTLAEYQRAERERIAAVADNAAVLKNALSIINHFTHQDRGAGNWTPDLSRMAAEISAHPHPGTALLAEMETLRQRQVLWEEAAHTLYGYGVFIGPCVHGRDPWDRCDECGEESAVHALMKVVAKKDEQRRKEVAALKQALESQQAESHTLRRAFPHERHRADTAGAPAEHAYNAQWAENLLADERKALVRARNEGLEKAAQWVAGCASVSAVGERQAADYIRAMKEPEPTESP